MKMSKKGLIFLFSAILLNLSPFKCCKFDFETKEDMDRFTNECDPEEVGKNWTLVDRHETIPPPPSIAGHKVITTNPGDQACLRTKKEMEMQNLQTGSVLLYIMKPDSLGYVELFISLDCDGKLTRNDVLANTSGPYPNGTWLYIPLRFILMQQTSKTCRVKIEMFHSNNCIIEIDQIILDTPGNSAEDCNAPPRETTTADTTTVSVQ